MTSRGSNPGPRKPVHALAHPYFDPVRERNSLGKSSSVELENDNSGADEIIDS